MYSLQELEAMAPEKTVSIAEDMGMKKANSADPQEVIYYILDNQATATAKEEASKVATRQSEGRKRGRKKTGASAPSESKTANEATQSADEKTAEPESAVKKKRGRKPKESKE